MVPYPKVHVFFIPATTVSASTQNTYTWVPISKMPETAANVAGTVERSGPVTKIFSKDIQKRHSVEVLWPSLS